MRGRRREVSSAPDIAKIMRVSAGRQSFVSICVTESCPASYRYVGPDCSGLSSNTGGTFRMPQNYTTLDLLLFRQ